MKRWLIPILLLLVAAGAFAQFQTGNIYGKVQGKDGGVLPGVTVTLTGVGAPQTQITDAQGNFRFLGLSPGTYALKAELAGYGSSTRTGIGVRVGANADIAVTMNPSVAESITVTAEAPLLDTRKAGSMTNVAKAELENVPQARDPWAVLQTTPSVMVDRINVGGTQSGQQSNYLAKGALGRDNTWNMDGVNITDMGATGSSPIYFDFDSFEEMQVTAGGSDPRIFTPGVQLNMVTKRGTNDFKGSGRYLYTPGSLSSSAGVPSEASPYLAAGNKTNFVRDYGGEFGGPIIHDRLWFWAARGDQKISVFQSQNVGAFIIPDNTVLRDKNLKFNGQILSSNSAVAFYTFGDKVRNARNLSPSRPFETAWHQAGPTKVYKLEDTQIVGSSLYLTGMWSKVSGGFGLFANGGFGESAPASWRDNAGVWHNNYETFSTKRPQKQYRIDGSKFFDIGAMNHEFKFGFGYRKTPVSSSTVWPGPAHGWMDFTPSNLPALCAANGLPGNCFRATVIRDVGVGYDEHYQDGYLGDTVLWGNLTLQLGVRMDHQRTTNLPISIGANPILANATTIPCTNALVKAGRCPGGSINAQIPALTYAGDPQWLKWNTITPRIGGTYALGADKRTLVRAAYNRYAGQLGSVVSGANPLAYSAFYFYGVDTNGDYTIQPNELKLVRSFTGLDPSNPSGVAVTRRVDYGMKVPTTDEFLVGFERELLTDFAVGVNYTYRKYNDLYWTAFEKHQGQGDYYTANDYVLATNAAGQPITVGGTFNANGHTFTTPTYQVYMLKPGVSAPLYRVVTTRPGYSQKYSGFELTATKRMSNRWMLRANASFNNYTESCSGADSVRNPTPQLGFSNASNNCIGGQLAPQSAGSGAFGNDFVNSKWNFNLTTAYQLPLDFNLGASLTARQGYPAVLRDAVSGLGGSGTTGGSTVTAILNPVGQVRFPNVYELDLRAAKDFRIMNRFGFTISADLFNAPDKRTILQRETSILNTSATSNATTSATNGWRITELQAPRVWRLGAKFTF